MNYRISGWERWGGQCFKAGDWGLRLGMRAAVGVVALESALWNTARTYRVKEELLAALGKDGKAFLRI